jgi:hypothetical protein
MLPVELWCKDLAGKLNEIVERDQSWLFTAVDRQAPREEVLERISQVTGRLKAIHARLTAGPSEGLGLGT